MIELVTSKILERIREREYWGTDILFENHKNIAELSREVILNLVENIIVYKNKEIRINFKFKEEYKKMISIFDMH